MPAEPEAAARLAAIRDDRSAGAAELAARAVDVFAAEMLRLAAATPEERTAAAAALLRTIRVLRPSMAPITNWALRFRELLPMDPAGADWPDAVAAAAARLDAERDAVHGRLHEAAAEVLGTAGHIVTLSRSSTVLDLLLEAAPHARVTVSEGRPGCEGRALAERLLAQGRTVRLTTEAQLALAVGGADLVLLGADTICRDLAAVNKVGSHLAALAAQAAGRPVLIAADTYKINPRVDAGSVPLEQMNGAEVWPERPGLADNTYFEPVPAGLIALYLTERGAMAPPALAAAVAEWSARYDAAGL